MQELTTAQAIAGEAAARRPSRASSRACARLLPQRREQVRFPTAGSMSCSLATGVLACHALPGQSGRWRAFMISLICVNWPFLRSVQRLAGPRLHLSPLYVHTSACLPPHQDGNNHLERKCNKFRTGPSQRQTQRRTRPRIAPCILHAAPCTLHLAMTARQWPMRSGYSHCPHFSGREGSRRSYRCATHQFPRRP